MKFLILINLLMMSVFAEAKEYKGVNFPDEVKVEKTVLKLNGTGLRKAMTVISVYAGALYVASPTKDENAILDSETPKRIIMHYKMDVDKNKITDALKEAFNKNRIDGYSYSADLEKLKEATVSMKNNQESVITFFKDRVEIQHGTAPVQTISGANFSRVYLSAYIRRPIDEDLKLGLLGVGK